MALARDNSDVPEHGPGNPPAPDSRFGHLLAEAWRDSDAEHQQSRTDTPRYIRLGWAGKCAREIGYRLLDVPETNPTDLAGYWRMNTGSMVHDLMDKVVPLTFPNAECEKLIGAEYDDVFGFPVSGRADLFLVTEDGKRTLVEYKTVGGYKFKLQTGVARRDHPPEGPDATAIHQAGLYGRALACDEVVLLSLSLECLSAPVLASLVKKNGGEPDAWRKFCAEWRYDMKDLDPLVDAEIKRLGKVMTMVDDYADMREQFMREDAGESRVSLASMLPPRSIPFEMPPRARVTDPMKGTWALVIEDNIMQSGTAWQCSAYCSWRDQCVADGPS